MRVLFLSDHADPLAVPGTGFQGGQNVYVRTLATHLADSGCTVDVATRRAFHVLPEYEPITAGAQVVRIPDSHAGPLPRDRFGEVLPEFARGVERLFERAGGYDVVHSHYWYSGRAALRLARRHRVPVVHTHHSLGAVREAALGETGSPPLSSVRHAAERRIGEECRALVVGCPAEAEAVRTLLGTPADRVRLVPPGVDIRPVGRAKARTALGIRPDVPLVLFLGRPERRKGWEELVHAFAVVRRRSPHARLLVVGGGDGSETAPLVALARRHGVLDSLDVRGSVPHARTAVYYSAADVTAVPSHYEPFGLVAVESMACGTPVVASRVGGLAWTVGGERLGALVPVRDADALADALLSVLGRGREHYRAACLARVAERFTAQTWTDGVLEVYRSVLSGPAAPEGSADDGTPRWAAT